MVRHAPFALLVFLTASTVFAQRGDFGRGPFGERGGEQTATPEPEDLDPELGVATVPDREAFEAISFQGLAGRDSYLDGLEFVKFILTKSGQDDSKIYWMNTKTFQAHPHFMGQIGMSRGRGGGRGGPPGRGRGGFDRNQNRDAEPTVGGHTMRGAITYLPRRTSPNGTAGLYIFDFQPNDRFAISDLKAAQDSILKTMPFVKGQLAYHAFRETEFTTQKEAFAKAGIEVHLDGDLFGDIGYLPLNEAESFGRLRLMDNETRPSPRDIVVCKTLPNQMPRVAGVITEVRQTPLSHVNLRAIQDKVPNAFVVNATKSNVIASLLGKFVNYKVTPQGYKLREATKEEVDAHFASIRPAEEQTPDRDLSQKEILPLARIKFADSKRFGVKAANVATMHSFDFPAETIPDGVAVPFYFYDEFMKHNGFYEKIRIALAGDGFRKDRDTQKKALANIRSQITQGKIPDWMLKSFAKAQESFPQGTSIRCRSSTNNEDLPGFSGAGLYDSFTHHPDEGHLAKSVKQVYASLWNFRAFEERDFYRIDHFQTAMGVLMHPNFSEEKANGVAVTDDILYETDGNYYLNTQLGEDLVTNPSEQSSPEEVLLSWYERDGHELVRATPDGKRLLSEQHLAELRNHLKTIHNRFSELYGHDKDDLDFAMEIEFKVTRDGKLAIKQARPWVF